MPYGTLPIIYRKIGTSIVPYKHHWDLIGLAYMR